MTRSAVGLRASGIVHAYAGLPALDGIDLDIPPGEVTVLIGPSGCGKSTLLGIIGGLLSPTAGEVRRFGPVAALRVLSGWVRV